jgi:hypothetical protein
MIFMIKKLILTILYNQTYLINRINKKVQGKGFEPPNLCRNRS